MKNQIRAGSAPMAVLLALAALSCLFVPAAQAGPFADDMSKCLLTSTSPTDREDLVRWIFAAAAAHPAVSTVVTVNEEHRASASRTVANLFVRLLTEDCLQQVRTAVEMEGEGTIEQSFQVLGELAGRELFDSPEVGAVVARLETYLDAGKLNAAFGGGKP